MSVVKEINAKIELDLLCKNLQSPERLIRQNALKELLKISSKQMHQDIDLNVLLDLTYLHIIKCYTDRYETCRALAAAILSSFLKNITNGNLYILDYIVPVLRRRLGQSEIIEESEELRLQLIEQVHEIVIKFACEGGEEDFLMKSYNDIIDIMLKTIADPFASVQRKCCEVIQALAVSTPSFYVRAEILVDPLINLLSHRQSATRMIAVETLGAVCLYINNKNDKIVKSIVSISPLLMDTVPLVRRECGRVGCRWLLDLPDRYSFFERILPLVLCCLKDETTDIRNEIWQKFNQCGAKYYEENENELQKLALIDSELPCSNYLISITNERPSLGCRALVQRSLRMISIVLVELQDWKEDVRLHSLKLLWQIILHAEKAFAYKFFEVFPILSKCCQDNDQSIVEEAKRVAILIGQLINYNDWIEHAKKGLESYPSSLGILRCFTSLFSGTENHAKTNNIQAISKRLADPAICHSLLDNYQNSLLDITEQLVTLHLAKAKAEQIKPLHVEIDELSINADIDENECGKCDEEEYLFQILIKVLALSNAHNNKCVEKRGTQILNELCKSQLNRLTLNGKYVKTIIESIEDLDCEHSERSERILLLYGCITLCGFQIEYFDAMKMAIRMVIENSTPNAKIKILTAVSIAMLNWNQQLNLTHTESVKLLVEFLDEIILPCLIWRAGRNAESIRTMATQALCAIGDAAPIEANEMFPKLATHFISLSEDNIAITRVYAIRCLLKCGAVPYEDYRTLTTSILNGLDDPCVDVRALAIECISHLQADKNSINYNENCHASIVEFTLSRLFLHLDDPYLKLRPILLDSITKIGKEHPTLFQNEINKLPKTYPYIDEINEIKKNINNK